MRELGETVMVNRNFKCLLATGVMLSLVLIPMGIGVAFVAAPCSGGPSAADVIITAVSDVPADGLPHRHTVSIRQHNVWTLAPPETIGYVFLRRTPGTSKITALSASHGASFNVPVKFIRSRRKFISQCWKIEFDSNGHALTAGFADLLRVPITVIDGQVTVRLKSGTLFAGPVEGQQSTSAS